MTDETTEHPEDAPEVETGVADDAPVHVESGVPNADDDETQLEMTAGKETDAPDDDDGDTD